MSCVPSLDDLTTAGFRTYTRAQWAALGRFGPTRGRDAGLSPVRAGGSDPVGADELDEVYRPLGQLLAVAAASRHEPIGERAVGPATEVAAPFVVGVTGSVAVGKSTVAAHLRAVLEGQPALQPVEVLSTDSFLFSNDRLAAGGLMARKGFPESSDRPRLIAALSAIRAGQATVEVPVYSHRDYDIVPGRHQVIARPTVLIVEGLDVLQGGPDEGGPRGDGSSVSDFLDGSIYVDAAEPDIARWHRERLLAIHRAGSAGTAGFLGWFCSLSEEEAAAVAEQSWSGINVVNLREHIAPTRDRASVILHKGPDHRVSHVRLRAG